MSDYWRRFQKQLWGLLAQIAAAATVIAAIAEGLLIYAAVNISAIATVLEHIISSPFGFLLPFGASVAVGALGVLLCEHWRPRLIPNVGNLWALVLCLIVGAWLKSYLLPQNLLLLTSQSVVGLIIGVFWKGRPYWTLRAWY
ncbi:hypothetical protein KR51_00024430 [Rubidibacter lacunae KORDI 51-2]|uniref:Peptide chain release factor 1 n=1 Tax=Rubidibacter lacunae KORDI 51-2 TaxID=582515 RepID=U5D8U9_9CHRO|nr:hypothetical protein [Rubidibacter lacunae]ERN41023.1 hypothetical protein KR51_00024430 [Rubidibacter lacunae KORDI 51-2]